jgi:UDP-N-acetylmuramate--alanine ligase
VTLVDDYGHHPEEILATLEAARRAYSQRIIVMFQPHRYSRTQQLFDDFTRAFNAADFVFVTDIYPAGEAPIPGIDAAALVGAISKHGHHQTHYFSDRQAMAEAVAKVAAPGDVVLSMGAGDINRVLPLVNAALQQRGAATDKS